MSAIYAGTGFAAASTIVTQLAGFGLGVGFDHSIDVTYQGGQPMAPPIAHWNVSYPWRGYKAEADLIYDCVNARSYKFPEDGSQTANQIYEIGGGGL